MKSKCCNSKIIGKGGNESLRLYYCSKCDKIVEITRDMMTPPSLNTKK